MTDNEIIKALECCKSSNELTACRKCPALKDNICGDCSAKISNGIMDAMLDLINRQKAEIEKLREENEIYRRVNFLIAGQRDERDKEIVSLESELKNSKSEAIRKFAEKLKNRAYKHIYKRFGSAEFVVKYEIPPISIDSIIKEMTEGGNGDNS